MTIEKGKPWGQPGGLPPDGVVVHSDREARTLVEAARRRQAAPPVLGLVGGDLCRTLGGSGDEARLWTAEAMTFPIDLGAVLVDGRLHWFVAHLVARNRWWTAAWVAMNTPWHGRWNLGPRAHPDDGLLDVYDATLRIADLAKVRSRLPSGTHLPLPGVTERRVGAAQVSFPRARPIWLDGERIGTANALSVRVEPDALRVVV